MALTEYFVLAITGVIFVVFVSWIVLMIIWGLGKLGVWKRRKFKSLKRQLGDDYEFQDEILEWCGDAFRKKWSYKDVKRFSKYETNGKETLYTYMMLGKLTPAERQVFIERRYE